MSNASRLPSGDDLVFFETVYRDECNQIRHRRDATSTAQDGEPLLDLRGLALSGGGIRSATFCLGVLQQLRAEGALTSFDYLSTVSGGGFVGGWWSAWLSRPDQASLAQRRDEIFPPKEKIEPARSRWAGITGAGAGPTEPEVDEPDGSKWAGLDPTHHLRLFANYLTPKKGALSGDTWRAITIISRNLLLTVIMLLPILAAAILAAQLYYVADKRLATDFACSDRSPAAHSGAQRTACDSFAVHAGAPATAMTTAGVPPGESSVSPLGIRAARFAIPLIVVAGWLLIPTVCWMWFSTGKLRWAMVASAGVLAMILIAPGQVASGGSSQLIKEIKADKWFLPALLIGASLLVVYIVAVGWKKRVQDRRAKKESRPPSGGEVLTNRMTMLQSGLQVTWTILAVVLLFGGFGHEAVRYVFLGTQNYVQRVGGWTALLATLAGAVFTALKAAPSGGADNQPKRASRLSTLTFAATPPLVLIALALGIATVTHGLLGTLRLPDPGELPPLHLALLVGIGICCFFAVYELWSDADAQASPRTAIALLSLVAGGAAFLVPPFDFFARKGAATIVGISIGLALVPWIVFRLLAKPSMRSTKSTDGETPHSLMKLRRVSTVVVVLLVVPIAAFLLGSIRISDDTAGQGHALVARLALAGMAFATTCMILLVVLAHRENRRVMSLLTGAIVLLAGLYVQQFLKADVPQVFFPTAIIALIGIALAAVVGLGWMVDPNYLSLHAFYRARLVRAYLGASNSNRRKAEITESAEGDDLMLTEVSNCDRGGPYHLINATLNLVAGRDLATAQRSAAYFTLSPLHCGSLRTGYRPTDHYMDGKLSLGTALAISGAAASPNMGTKSTSSALAMLLALLNVRLGFWAPTPNRTRWTSPRPRLWPFYLLREFLSQTNDLSSYCYLTDGGHFDNTGIYSLVQRGCRSILLVDCGADPAPCFEDVGDAVRRCQIDFGAEIDLSVAKFSRKKGERFSSSHVTLGKVVYSVEHAKGLGWKNYQDEAARTGLIVWIKPSLLADDPVEVLQYSLENDDFPQQTTADQWFDEAQFEGYRRLGRVCAQAAYRDPTVQRAFPRRP